MVLSLKIDKKEVLRYLGYGTKSADDNINKIIDECIEILKNNAREDYIYEIFDASLEENVIIDDGLTFLGNDIKKHLVNCEKVAILGATLGREVDVLLRRYAKNEASKAIILHACATALIEGVCDNAEGEIKKKASENGYYITTRYSPGYGDLPLEHQTQIINMLKCDKKIGLTVTENFLLVPSKSVTAIIGFTKQQPECKKGCKFCSNYSTCKFKKE